MRSSWGNSEICIWSDYFWQVISLPGFIVPNKVFEYNTFRAYRWICRWYEGWVMSVCRTCLQSLLIFIYFRLSVKRQLWKGTYRMAWVSESCWLSDNGVRLWTWCREEYRRSVIKWFWSWYCSSDHFLVIMAYLEYAFNLESNKKRTQYVETMNSQKKNTINGYIRIFR